MQSNRKDAPPPSASRSPSGEGAARAWTRRAKRYEWLEASDLRRGPAKRDLFRRMRGETLFVGIGTGLDIAPFPHGPAITAIDISFDMLDRAQPRLRRYLEDTPHEGGPYFVSSGKTPQRFHMPMPTSTPARLPVPSARCRTPTSCFDRFIVS